MQKIQITKMCKDDLQDIYKICESSFPIPWEFTSFENELSNILATYLIAKIENKIVGYIGLWFIMDECQIVTLAIHEDYRRQGIASLLLNAMMKECKKHGTTYISLDVRASNIAAQKLYAKYGFIEETIRKKYYLNPDNSREDAIIMGMSL